MDRSVTPPPSSLLTPPPTGGSDKRFKFIDEGLPDTILKRLSKCQEGEYPTAFFEEVEEGSDVDIDESEEEPTSPIVDTPPTSATTAISSTSNGSNFERNDLFAPGVAKTAAFVITEPFPLLRLPISLRTKVFEHLLVVSGLICVRQKQATLDQVDAGYLHAEPREVLPGIDHAVGQLSVNGRKISFPRFASTNSNILLASKDIHAEASAVLYGKNNFEIPRPSTELNPPTDYSVRLFPPSCQRLVIKLNIRIRSFYDLDWLLTGGYNNIKNFYRGLSTLTLIFEIDSVKNGFGRQWARQEGEKWQAYVMRLQIEIVKDAYAVGKGKKVKVMPDWIILRVFFGGELYDEQLRAAVTMTAGRSEEQVKRDELRTALVEAWELFKRVGR
ncbi:hypothetical protein DE146DRAFT_612772 [Phaeosphaeria sp. MPI-PUGE-AT-0046c]|nr:hypothetical protein DE146DRAFT_612772 [Phaeosphaeria sp. MPI-PUGE-AT-0046c]